MSTVPPGYYVHQPYGPEPHDVPKDPSEGQCGYSPSPVLLLRRVHWSVTIAQVLALGQRFGEVGHVVMLRSRNHALLEFLQLQHAQRMVETSPTVELGEYTATVGFCKHQRWIAPEPSSTLLVSFLNTDAHLSECICVTPALVYQIFAPYGAVERVVVLPKKAGKHRIQALVQFASSEHAEMAKGKLQGLPVWIGGKTQVAVDLLFAKMPIVSYDYSPETSLVVPPDCVTLHKEMIDKYGSLAEAFDVSAEEMSLEQLGDFQCFVSMLRKEIEQQKEELGRHVKQLEEIVEDLPRLEAAVREVMRSLHSRLAAKMHGERGITPEVEQALLASMRSDIESGDLASTARLASEEE